MTSGEQYARALGSCNGLAANIRILAEMFLEGA